MTWRVGPDLRMHRTGVDDARIPIGVRMSMVFRRGYGTSGIVVPNVTGISLTISSLYGENKSSIIQCCTSLYVGLQNPVDDTPHETLPQKS